MINLGNFYTLRYLYNYKEIELSEWKINWKNVIKYHEYERK